MTRTTWCLVFAALALVALGVFGVARWRAAPLTNTQLVEKLDSLPASWVPSLSPDPNSPNFGIKAIRLHVAREGEHRNLHVLDHPSIALTLRSFDAYDCADFNDRSLGHLRDAVHLHSLVLEGTKVTNKSAEIIPTYFPQLKFLDIEDTNLSQPAVEFILMNSSLELLDISPLLIDMQELKAFAQKHSPTTIIMVDGKDIMDQPQSVRDAITPPF